eukprot:Clim_evm26s229 gene=Clim_evmTU26s229
MAAPATDHDQETCLSLCLAAVDGDIKTASKLLLSDRSLAKCSMEGSGLTPLHYAATRASNVAGRRTAEMVLVNGADVNAQDVSGNTPMHTACIEDNQQVTRSLLDANANARMTNRIGATCLHVAALNDSQKCVKLIIDSHKGDVGIADHRGNLPLHFACMTGNVATADLLLKAPPASTSLTPKQMLLTPNQSGMTAAHAAAKNCQLPVVRWLKERAKDAGVSDAEIWEAKDNRGRTPGDSVSTRRSTECDEVRALLTGNADPPAKKKAGQASDKA